MDTNTVEAHVLVATDTRGRRISSRRHRTIDEKRTIVAAAFAPGASVAAVARDYGVNANLVFAWHRLQQQGLLEAHSRRVTGRKLVPVKLLERIEPGTTLRVEFAGGVQLHLGGALDAALVERIVAQLKA